jgi:hypothetical protein
MAKFVFDLQIHSAVGTVGSGIHYSHATEDIFEAAIHLSNVYSIVRHHCDYNGTDALGA